MLKSSNLLRSLSGWLGREVKFEISMSNLPDDLLWEIFIRMISDAKLAIQCRLVCKRWFSLLSNPEFIHKFREVYDHKRCFDSPYTILFRPYHCTYRRVYELYSKKSKILYGARSSVYEKLFPQPMAIKASFEDLLLVSPSYKDYSIYNPLTGQCVALPTAPKGRNEICGFLCETKNYQFYYMVLLIIDIHKNDNEYILSVAIFCSETGEWRRLTLLCPRTLAPEFEIWSDFVASNGILYSQLNGKKDDIRGFAAFDLSNIRDDKILCRFIHLPIDFDHVRGTSFQHVCSGVVRGRLRLSQMQFLRTDELKFDLKVWELSHSNNGNLKWILGHEVRLKRRNTYKMFVGVAAFHPNNGNEIFMFCGCELYKYKIGQGKHEKVGKLPNPDFEHNPYVLTRYLSKFTLIHPSWPTSIPTLPSL